MQGFAEPGVTRRRICRSVFRRLQECKILAAIFTLSLSRGAGLPFSALQALGALLYGLLAKDASPVPW
jgi:hypothetical protein